MNAISQLCCRLNVLYVCVYLNLWAFYSRVIQADLIFSRFSYVPHFTWKYHMIAYCMCLLESPIWHAYKDSPGEIRGHFRIRLRNVNCWDSRSAVHVVFVKVAAASTFFISLFTFPHLIYLFVISFTKIGKLNHPLYPTRLFPILT